MIAQFIYTSFSELRFGVCQNLLEKLEEVENSVCDQLLPSRGKLSQPLSPLPYAHHDKSTPTSHDRSALRFVCTSNEGKFDVTEEKKEENRRNSQKKFPNLSLRNLIPDILPHSPLSVSGHTVKLSLDSKKVPHEEEEVADSR